MNEIGVCPECMSEHFYRSGWRDVWRDGVCFDNEQPVFTCHGCDASFEEPYVIEDMSDYYEEAANA
jgi:transposase-like protein